MQKIILLLSLIIVALIFAGCPTTKETAKEQPALPKPPAKPVVPEIMINVASVSLAKFSKRIEERDIDQFADTLKKRKIDILTIQGVFRYPGVATRLDIVDELARRTEMRQAFGETINLSGRQSGNTVFSVYPIHSSDNTHYEGLQASNFEAALQSVVDCGVRDIVIVSTGIPEKASLSDLTICANKLGSFSIFYLNHPIIIAGNLPKWDAIQKMEQYESLKPVGEDNVPRMWFSNDGSLKLIHQTVQHTNFGPMTVAQFGIYRQHQP